MGTGVEEFAKQLTISICREALASLVRMQKSQISYEVAKEIPAHEMNGRFKQELEEDIESLIHEEDKVSPAFESIKKLAIDLNHLRLGKEDLNQNFLSRLTQDYDAFCNQVMVDRSFKNRLSRQQYKEMRRAYRCLYDVLYIADHYADFTQECDEQGVYIGRSFTNYFEADELDEKNAQSILIHQIEMQDTWAIQKLVEGIISKDIWSESTFMYFVKTDHPVSHEIFVRLVSYPMRVVRNLCYQVINELMKKGSSWVFDFIDTYQKAYEHQPDIAKRIRELISHISSGLNVAMKYLEKESFRFQIKKWILSANIYRLEIILEMLTRASKDHQDLFSKYVIQIFEQIVDFHVIENFLKLAATYDKKWVKECLQLGIGREAYWALHYLELKLEEGSAEILPLIEVSIQTSKVLKDMFIKAFEANKTWAIVHAEILSMGNPSIVKALAQLASDSGSRNHQAKEILIHLNLKGDDTASQMLQEYAKAGQEWAYEALKSVKTK